MIISKKKYKKMCDLIILQSEIIRLSGENIHKLRRTICDFMVQQPQDIDFPATEKLHEDKLF